MIGAVLLDVGGTLLEVSPSVGHLYARACAARGARVEPGALQEAFDRAWVGLSAEVPPGEDRYRHFEGGEDAWWRRVSDRAFESCGVPPENRPSTSDLRGLFSRPSAWHVYPEVRASLVALRGRGFRLAVVSNWDSRLEGLLDRLDLLGHFEAVACSAAVGHEKPHPAIFKAALEALGGIPPDEAVHIGDRLEEDYRGAREVGLRALLVVRDGSAPFPQEEEWEAQRDRVADLGEAVLRIAQ